MTLEQHITQVLTLSSLWEQAADSLSRNDLQGCDKALSNFRKIHRGAALPNKRAANDQ